MLEEEDEEEEEEEEEEIDDNNKEDGVEEEQGGKSQGCLTKVLKKEIDALVSVMWDSVRKLAEEHSKDAKTLFNYLEAKLQPPRRVNCWNAFKSYCVINGPLKEENHMSINYV